jgi:hypothetical protein
MTSQEFQIEMGRLVSTFGKQHYPEERVKLIWREVGNLTGNAFANMVEGLISECRQAPLIPEIREKAAKVRERAWSEQKKTADVISINKNLCAHCGGAGSFPARNKADRSAFAFKCNCSFGKNDMRPFPVWGPQWEADFTSNGEFL